jgi:predicted phosphodiesterase
LGVRWNSDIDNRRIELLRFGHSYSQIANILSFEFSKRFTMKSVENRCRITNTTKSSILLSEIKGHNKNSNEIKKNIKSKNKSNLFPEELYTMNTEIVFAPEKKRALKEIWDSFNDGKSKKILSLSDLHAPFINFKSVEEALKIHQDADILILNGDVFDGNALSDFDKLNDFDIEVEFEQVFALLDVVSEMFKKIYWVGGNHDLSRFFRMVSRKFGSGMKKYVLKRLNPITYIAEKYENVIVIPHQWMQIGKAVFIHPDGYSSALMSSSLQQEKVLRANSKEMLPHPDFEALIMGHTHDAGEFFINGCKILEQGALCHQMDYRFDNPSSRKWVQGYAVVHLKNDGSVDFNNTRVYVI